jgi:hypothetical protein
MPRLYTAASLVSSNFTAQAHVVFLWPEYYPRGHTLSWIFFCFWHQFNALRTGPIYIRKVPGAGPLAIGKFARRGSFQRQQILWWCFVATMYLFTLKWTLSWGAVYLRRAAVCVQFFLRGFTCCYIYLYNNSRTYVFLQNTNMVYGAALLHVYIYARK